MFDLLPIRGNRGNLLFLAVRRIAAVRCFRGLPISTVSMVTQVKGRDTAELSHSMLTSLPTCFRLENFLLFLLLLLLLLICRLIYSVILQLLDSLPLTLWVRVERLAQHTGGFGFLLKKGAFCDLRVLSSSFGHPTS